MRDYQARGYIFESVIWRLLERFNYIGVESAQLRGRGASHQIDAYGQLRIPTPFIYPIRILCEAKCYRDPIELEKIRNFVGVIKDISENYIIGTRGERNIPDRFTDVGCYFSASGFTLPAQNYAWAHNIFVVSFMNVPVLKSTLDFIKVFVKTYSVAELSAKSKDDVVKEFWSYFEERWTDKDKYSKTTLAIGVLDGVYPVVLIGKDRWIQSIDERHNFGDDRIIALKTTRISNSFDTLFKLDLEQKTVYFTVPNLIANKLINKIDNSINGESIFKIDLPYISNRNEFETRRIFSIDVMLSLSDKEEYISKLNAIDSDTNEDLNVV